MEEPKDRRTMLWPVYLALLLLAVVIVVFVAEFISASQQSEDHSAIGLTAETYMPEVEALLATADPEKGDHLIDQYECGACHRQAADRIAPSYVGLAERAASRRPPLTAAAYIYESIMFPDRYVVEGYKDAMVKNYPDRLSDEELGDIIAYLLTVDAH